jgi:hypothetical protein
MSSAGGLPLFPLQILRLIRTPARLYVRSTNGEPVGFAGRSVEAPWIESRKCRWHSRAEFWYSVDLCEDARPLMPHT